MTMDRALWWWFLALYAQGIIGFLGNVLRIRRERPAFEQQIGPLPEVGAFVAWFVPPLILLSGIGKMAIDQPILRALGVGLSLYALIVVAWTIRTLGRLLIPGLAVFRDHVLVTSGPFRWLRHPLYSGGLALWLGAALGTLNWLLLALWPLFVAAILRELPTEEGMLRAKFGAAFEAYAAQTGRLLPRLRGRRKSPRA
jgi:protein-S-isoprenylcysteine O-methyltransferase Ste14